MKIFYLETPSIGYHNGIGTYLNNLLYGITSINFQCNLYYLKISFNEDQCSFQKEKIKINNQNITYINLVIKKKIMVQNGDYLLSENDCRSILCVISEYLNDEKIIFHLNTIIEYKFVLILKEYGIKVVYTQHVALWEILYNNNFSDFQKDVKLLKTDELQDYKGNLKSICIDKINCKSSDATICLNEKTKEILSEYYHLPQSNIYVIANGLKSSEKTIKKKRIDILRRYGFDQNEYLILFVGRLIPDKGLDDLITVFQNISPKYPNFRLLIAGRGNIERYLLKYQKSCGKITFFGQVSQEVLGDLHAITDIGILPSKTEQSSFVVLEMMRNKTPLIVSDIYAYYSNLYDQCFLKTKVHNGNIDLNHLESNILKFYRNPILAKQYADTAFKSYSMNFQATKMALHTTNIYNDII